MSQCLNPDCLRQNPTNPKFCQSCGTKLLLSDRYRAIKVIGQGGFGRTFLAEDEQKFKRQCVIKQFLPQAQGTSTVEKASELFLSEAEQLNNLGNHPQIPELLAYFTQDNRQYLVQEFIEGQNLADILDKVGAFNETQLSDLLTSLLPVFEFIHSQGVIHRDVKPPNIIRRVDGQLVLVDFGAAKQTTVSTLSVTGTVIGTAGYTAPEQAVGKAVPASDIYSLGVTCIHLLTGVQPKELFDTDEGEWVWRNYLQSNVSNELGQILDKMIESGSKKRYQSATKVLEALQPSSVPPTVISAPPSPTKKATMSIPLKSAKGIDYTQLQNLLERGQWQEADQETLNVMLQAAGRTKEGWLDLDACRNFPQVDLRTIDDLWVKYSNGKFGFSVQKRIWQKKKGWLLGQDDWDTYVKLGDEVGWREKGSWLLSYSNLTFNTNAPAGHLPALWCWRSSWLVCFYGGEPVSLLFSLI